MSIMDTKDEYPALRERFHVWCRSEGIDPELWMADHPERGYKNPRTQDYWMGWLQCAKAFGVTTGDAGLTIPGLSTLENVIDCLRTEARYLDEEGEATNQLEDLRDALRGGASVGAKVCGSTEQALGLYATQADGIRELLDVHAPHTTGNLLQRIAQVFAGAPALSFEEWSKDQDLGLPGSFTWNAARKGWEGRGKAGVARSAASEQQQTREFFERISKDKQASIAFLRDAGILDDHGQLAEPYREGSSNKENKHG